jgi:hypothetical protein
MEDVTYEQVFAMFEHGALSSSVFYRRHTLLSLCEMAAKAKGVHDPLSRWRLKRFRAALEGMEGNDEVEVTGETLCETVMLAMSALKPRV